MVVPIKGYQSVNFAGVRAGVNADAYRKDYLDMMLDSPFDYPLEIVEKIPAHESREKNKIYVAYKEKAFDFILKQFKDYTLPDDGKKLEEAKIIGTHTPTLIQQGEKYFVYGSYDGKTWAFTELNHLAIAKIVEKERIYFSTPRGCSSLKICQQMVLKKGHSEHYEIELGLNKHNKTQHKQGHEWSEITKTEKLTAASILSHKDVLFLEQIMDTAPLKTFNFQIGMLLGTVELYKDAIINDPRIQKMLPLISALHPLTISLKQAYVKAKKNADSQGLYELEQIAGRIQELVTFIPLPVKYNVEFVDKFPGQLAPNTFYLTKTDDKIYYMFAGMKERMVWTNAPRNIKNNLSLTIKHKEALIEFAKNEGLDVSLVPFFDDSDYEKAVSSYNARAQAFNKSLDELGKLAQHLSVHSSPVWRDIGRALMVIGALAVVAFVIVAAVPSFAGAFSAALGSAGLLSASTTIASGFGITGAAAGAAGASMVGSVAGLGIGLGGLWMSLNRLSLSSDILAVSSKLKESYQVNKTNSNVKFQSDDLSFDQDEDLNMFNTTLEKISRNRNLHQYLYGEAKNYLNRNIGSRNLYFQSSAAVARYDKNKTEKDAKDVLEIDLANAAGVLMFKFEPEKHKGLELSQTLNSSWKIEPDNADKRVVCKEFMAEDKRECYVCITAADAYETLGVKSNASNDDLVNAYYKYKASKHPEIATKPAMGSNKGGGPGLFKPVNGGIQQPPADPKSLTR